MITWSRVELSTDGQPVAQALNDQGQSLVFRAVVPGELTEDGQPQPTDFPSLQAAEQALDRLTLWSLWQEHQLDGRPDIDQGTVIQVQFVDGSKGLGLIRDWTISWHRSLGLETCIARYRVRR
jgi:hypothetical protein